MSKSLGLNLFYVELDNNDVYTALKQKVEETMTGTQWNGEDNEILPADFDEDTVSYLLSSHDISYNVPGALPRPLSNASPPTHSQNTQRACPWLRAR